MPKVKNPASLMEYRPISSCSVVLYSKVLMLRLEMVLPELVSTKQNAPMKARVLHIICYWCMMPSRAILGLIGNHNVLSKHIWWRFVTWLLPIILENEANFLDQGLSFGTDTKLMQDLAYTQQERTSIGLGLLFCACEQCMWTLIQEQWKREENWEK